MSVAVLKLEDGSFIAFNLNMVSMMDCDEKGVTFIHEGVVFSTHPECKLQHRRLKLHISTKESPEGNYKAFGIKAMFEKFCNL